MSNGDKVIRHWGLTLLLLSVSGTSLSAQTSTESHPSAWLIGASIGVPGHGSNLEPEFFTVGAHATRVEPGRPGGDFAVGTMPRVLMEGVLPVGARAGLALPLELSENLLLVASGGASMIAALGGGGGLTELGLNFGAAALVLNEGSTGLRAGITWHRFRDLDGTVWLLELGAVARRDNP